MKPVDWVYRQLSRAQAQSHFDDYVASEADRIDAFRRAVMERGGPDLDGGRESLGALGAWMLSQLEPGPRDGELPMWARRPMGTELPGRVSAETLWLIDGANAYFVDCLRRRHPQLRWELALDRQVSDYQQPVLAGFGQRRLEAPWPAFGVFAAALADPPKEDWLLEAFDAWEARVDRAVKPEEPDLEDVEVRAIDDPEWDVQIWISEAAEPVLGRPAFESLEERIGSLPGIEALVWEDREVFLARLEAGTELSALRADVAALLRQMLEGSPSSG